MCILHFYTRNINPSISGRLPTWCEKPTRVSVHRSGAYEAQEILPVEQGIKITVHEESMQVLRCTSRSKKKVRRTYRLTELIDPKNLQVVHKYTHSTVTLSIQTGYAVSITWWILFSSPTQPNNFINHWITRVGRDLQRSSSPAPKLKNTQTGKNLNMGTLMLENFLSKTLYKSKTL